MSKQLKKVSLSDLGMKSNEQQQNQDTNIKTVDISDIVEIKPTESPEKEFERKELELIDKGIERTKQDLLNNVINPIKEACIAVSLSEEADNAITDSTNDLEKQLEEEAKHNRENNIKYTNNSTEKDLEELLQEEGDTVTETFTINNNIEYVNKPSTDSHIEELEAKKDEINIPEATVQVPSAEEEMQEKISDEDLQDLLDEESDVELTDEEKAEQKKLLDDYRKQVFEKLGMPATIEKGEIKKFRISTKPVSVNSILKNVSNEKKLNTATWVLPNSGRLITFSALSGEEIENLNPDQHDADMNADLANRLVFNTIYDHLIDPKKPDTMEKWLRTINWFDLNDIYFGLYLATFKNNNYVTYSCTKDKCKNIFLIPVDYNDMITYTDDDAKKVYQNIMKTGVDLTPEEIPEDIVPINDKFAIGFRAPSVFDIIFGAASLDAQFRNKYATTIGNISYMSNVYYIKDDVLFPVDCKAVKDNPAKTMRNKIVAYYNILKTLSPDEYSVVTRSIADINKKHKAMATFHYPDTKCPKCLTEIKRSDAELNPLTMLFIRHRLVQYASTTIE